MGTILNFLKANFTCAKKINKVVCIFVCSFKNNHLIVFCSLVFGTTVVGDSCDSIVGSSTVVEIEVVVVVDSRVVCRCSTDGRRVEGKSISYRFGSRMVPIRVDRASVVVW